MFAIKALYINGTIVYFLRMKIKQLLFCWIGQHDLDACINNRTSTQPGPIAQAVQEIRFDEVHLLHAPTPDGAYSHALCEKYRQWLEQEITACPVNLHSCSLKNPMDYPGIYEQAESVVDRLVAKRKKEVELTFHLSPGTSAMAAVWIILAKVDAQIMWAQTARLIHSSEKQGVQEAAEFPFDIHTVLNKSMSNLQKSAAKIVKTEFIAEAQCMKAVLAKLTKVAPWSSVSVLLTGETGTGKEKVANLIHKIWKATDKKARKDASCISINCAALPRELIESELFGYVKGAFTGADKEKNGAFQDANGGTLFLDEVGELHPEAQAKLLRALQEKKVRKVGATSEETVDVRVIAATNRDLGKMIRDGSFREDLYYRLAEAQISIPPLRERKIDIMSLAEIQLQDLNDFGRKDKVPGFQPKKFHKDVKSFLLDYNWPGNIRELQHVITQVTIWSDNPLIMAKDIERYIRVTTKTPHDSSDDQMADIVSPFNLKEHLHEVKKKYIQRALLQEGNQDAAARLLGYSSRSSIQSFLHLSNKDNS